MRMLKFLMIPTLFVSITSAKAMFDDDTKIFLVHASNVMAENNTKIAGSQFRTLTDETLHIEPEGTNLRTRITLHHGLGGMVPNSTHGVHIMGIKLDSHLGTDRDVCAYLDPLSAFSGEVFGGRAADFMTIDRHVYGESSIVIVPTHKVDEFHHKNPDYKGKLVVFDPHVLSLRQKIDDVIGEILNAPNFAEINDTSNVCSLLNFFRERKYSNTLHSLTTFRLLEYATNTFRQTIYNINQGHKPNLPPADQVRPLSSVIRTLLKDTRQKVGPTLSAEKRGALDTWALGLNDWLHLFETDADFRSTEGKSLFLNNSCVGECIGRRGDTSYPYSPRASLPSSELDMNTKGKTLFPTKEFEGIL